MRQFVRPKQQILKKNELMKRQAFQQRRQWHPTPVPLPEKSRGWRSLVGCSPWGSWKSDTTERLHFHFSLSCIGEGNGNPLQCSCLENPRDGWTSWAAIYGVAQSRTQLKRLSSSSSSRLFKINFREPVRQLAHKENKKVLREMQWRAGFSKAQRKDL